MTRLPLRFIFGFNILMLLSACDGATTANLRRANDTGASSDGGARAAANLSLTSGTKPDTLLPAVAGSVDFPGWGPKNPMVYTQGSTVLEMEMAIAQSPGPVNAATTVKAQPYFTANNGQSWTALPAFNVWNAGTQIRKQQIGDSSFLYLDSHVASAANPTGPYRGELWANLMLWSVNASTYLPNNAANYDAANAPGGACSRTDAPSIVACATASAGTWDYRMLLFGSANGGASWNFLSTIKATAEAWGLVYNGTTPFFGHTNGFHGLWSNRLFERSDGKIFVYFDDEDLANQSHPSSAFLSSASVTGALINTDANLNITAGSHIDWTTAVTAVGGDQFSEDYTHEARIGMASVSEICRIGGFGPSFATDPTGYYGKPGDDCTQIMTMEDDITAAGDSGAHGVVLVYANQMGGDPAHWTYVSTVYNYTNNQFFEVFAPAHIRNNLTGHLDMVIRSDLLRATDLPSYNSIAHTTAAAQGATMAFDGQILFYSSTDDGLSWSIQNPTGFYLGGGANSSCTSDPGIAQQPTDGQHSFVLINVVQYGYYDSSWVFHSPPANACDYSATCTATYQSSHVCADAKGCVLTNNVCVGKPLAGRWATDYMQISSGN